MEKIIEFYLRWDITIEPEIRKCELKRKVVGVERPEAKNFLVTIFPHIHSDPKYGWHKDIGELVLGLVDNRQDIASVGKEDVMVDIVIPNLTYNFMLYETFSEKLGMGELFLTYEDAQKGWNGNI